MKKQASSPNWIKVNCGELCKSDICNATELNLLSDDIQGLKKNVVINFAKFVMQPQRLPSRMVDLLYIAANVFCADRMVFRGERKSVSNSSWARSFEFNIPISDYRFWNQARMKDCLSEMLRFMTGDRDYRFAFRKAKGLVAVEDEPQETLFKSEADYINDEADVVLFSGGLDSLAGVVERLNSTDNKIVLVSHKSNAGVVHTQNQLICELQRKYGSRIIPYGFECHNARVQSIEETQRTRMFLFSAIAYAIALCSGNKDIYIFENGVTSINYAVQVDTINARASRTTHPKTIELLQRFYAMIDNSIKINTPYYNKTKAEVTYIIKKYGEEDLISSTVSCSSTRKLRGKMSHCGVCSQCIDRRFALFSMDMQEYDDDYYDSNFIVDENDNETKQRLYDLLFFSSSELGGSSDELLRKNPKQLLDLINYWPLTNKEDAKEEIYNLLVRYGETVFRAAQRMQTQYEDLRKKNNEGSLLQMLSDRTYFKAPVRIKVEEIDKILCDGIPIMFRDGSPQNENELNNKIQAIIQSAAGNFSREYPVLRFGISSYRADLGQDAFVIESKYLRGGTTPSKASEAIAADIIKIPEEIGVMFVVYDPQRSIVQDNDFISGFESKRGNCFVRIYR